MNYLLDEDAEPRDEPLLERLIDEPILPDERLTDEELPILLRDDCPYELPDDERPDDWGVEDDELLLPDDELTVVCAVTEDFLLLDGVR